MLADAVERLDLARSAPRSPPDRPGAAASPPGSSCSCWCARARRTRTPASHSPRLRAAARAGCRSPSRPAGRGGCRAAASAAAAPADRICGRSCLWQHGEHRMIAAPARRPRCSAWSVAVSQACSAIITSIASGSWLAHVAGHEAQARRAPARSRGAVARARPGRAQLDAGDLGRAAERAAQVVVQREGQVALARAEVDDADRAVAAGQPRRRERVVEDLDELVDLLPLARHRRHQPALARR